MGGFALAHALHLRRCSHTAPGVTNEAGRSTQSLCGRLGRSCCSDRACGLRRVDLSAVRNHGAWGSRAAVDRAPRRRCGCRSPLVVSLGWRLIGRGTVGRSTGNGCLCELREVGSCGLAHLSALRQREHSGAASKGLCSDNLKCRVPTAGREVGRSDTPRSVDPRSNGSSL